MSTKEENLSLDKPQKRDKPSNSTKLIILANWVFLISFIFSVLAMIIYAFVYPDKSISDGFTNTFYFTLGWFGANYISFLRSER